jgi:hypothetical protein
MKKVAQITMVMVIGFVLAASIGYTAYKEYSGFLWETIIRVCNPAPKAASKSPC